jgi:hypothetical protein
MKDLRRSPLAVQQSDAFIAADLAGSRRARASFGRLSREKAYRRQAANPIIQAISNPFQFHRVELA